MNDTHSHQPPRDDAQLESKAIIHDITQDLRFHLLATKAAAAQAEKLGDINGAKQLKAQSNSLLHAINLLLQ